MHEADELKAREAIERLDRIVSDETRKHSGFVILEKGEGDSHFCVFEKPSDAVVAAIAIQQAVSNFKWNPGVEVKVRAAVHCGEADLRGRTYYGLPVIRCARLRGAAHGGQTIVSQSVRSQVTESVIPGIEFADLGNHRLRDLLHPERIFQVNAPGLPKAFPHLKSADYHPNNLPIQISSFIGRKSEIERTYQVVARNRLTTIIGAGGSGKTRLAIQVGAEHLEHFDGGTFFVDLVPLTTQEEIEEAICFAITGSAGLPNTIPIEPDKPYLLILDNCEHLIDNAASVAGKWLRKFPNIKILATSREGLRLSGEAQMPLEPLPVPAENSTFDEGRNFDSVRLFEERATLRDERFRLTQINYEVVAKVCRSVDGLPLAIEIAASNLDWAPIADLPGMFTRDPAGLESSERDVDRRHRTLADVYEWSFELLSEPERRLLENASLFATAWTIDAASGTESLEITQIQKLVASLVRKSMVIPVEAPGPKRFRMLETVREFAQRKLGDRAHQVRMSIASHFAKLAERTEPKFRGPEQSNWLQQFELDLPNFQLAYESLIESDPEGALAMALSLRHFFLRLGLFRHGVDWLERAIAKVGAGDVYNLAVARRTLATFHWRLGDYGQAATEFEGSASQFKNLGRERDLAATVHNLGLLYLVQAKYAEAQKWLSEANHLYDSVGEPFERSRGMMSMSRLHLDQHQPVPALEWIERARVILVDIDDAGGLSIADGNTAEAMLQLGELDQAMQALASAFPRWRSVHDEMAFASAAILLGVVLSRQGQFEQAAECVGFALACQKRTGSPFSDHQQRLIGEAVGPNLPKVKSGRQADFDRALESCVTIASQVNIR